MKKEILKVTKSYFDKGAFTREISELIVSEEDIEAYYDKDDECIHITDEDVLRKINSSIVDCWIEQLTDAYEKYGDKWQRTVFYFNDAFYSALGSYMNTLSAQELLDLAQRLNSSIHTFPLGYNREFSIEEIDEYV